MPIFSLNSVLLIEALLYSKNTTNQHFSPLFFFPFPYTKHLKSSLGNETSLLQQLKLAKDTFVIGETIKIKVQSVRRYFVSTKNFLSLL
jgi:hypothetical protein